jgi:hypothetical protein
MLTVSFAEELIISLLTNGPLSMDDVRRGLAGRGPIASITPTGPSAAAGGVTAWLVEFRYYADCKEAIRVCLFQLLLSQLPANHYIADA